MNKSRNNRTIENHFYFEFWTEIFCRANIFKNMVFELKLTDRTIRMNKILWFQGYFELRGLSLTGFKSLVRLHPRRNPFSNHLLWTCQLPKMRLFHPSLIFYLVFMWRLFGVYLEVAMRGLWGCQEQSRTFIRWKKSFLTINCPVNKSQTQ